MTSSNPRALRIASGGASVDCGILIFPITRHDTNPQSIHVMARIRFKLSTPAISSNSLFLGGTFSPQFDRTAGSPSRRLCPLEKAAPQLAGAWRRAAFLDHLDRRGDRADPGPPDARKLG